AINFEGILSSRKSFKSFPTPPGLTRAGVNFTITNARPGEGLDVTGRDYYAPVSYPSDFLVPSMFTRTGTDLAITLPGSFRAIGLDLGSFSGGTFTFALSTGKKFNATPTGFGNLSFLGFTSTESITSLTISAAGSEVIVLDNFAFGTSVPS